MGIRAFDIPRLRIHPLFLMLISCVWLSGLLVKAAHISSYLRKALKEIPAALRKYLVRVFFFILEKHHRVSLTCWLTIFLYFTVTLEATPGKAGLEEFYGLLAGFIVCMTGHRRGVLADMRVKDVASADCDASGRRIIGVRTCCLQYIFF